MLIDTHAHLNFPDFKNDLDEVVQDALKNGVSKIICVSSSLKDSYQAIEIAKKYPGVVYASVGIHPHHTLPNKTRIKEGIKDLEKLAQKKEVVAIGECGLDFSPAPPGEKEHSYEEQAFLFEEQIKIAQKLNLPLIIHSRKAFDEVYEILKGKDLSGVFHCYSSGKSEIKKVLDLGFYFGLDGNLTYDLGLQNVVKEMPLERILLETDSPYLSPLPFRNLRNTPSNVKIIATFLSGLFSLNEDKIEEVTSANAQKLFLKT